MRGVKVVAGFNMPFRVRMPHTNQVMFTQSGEAMSLGNDLLRRSSHVVLLHFYT